MLEFKKVVPNNIIAIVTYAKVKHKGRDEISVESLEDGSPFKIIGKELVEKCFSADQYDEVVKLTKTEIAQKLTESHNKPLTVVFEKTDGTERTLRGRLLSSEPLMGRSYVEDLETTEPNKVRLVDHRTISSLIVDNKNYRKK